jgi:hypothetical protein
MKKSKFLVGLFSETKHETDETKPGKEEKSSSIEYKLATASETYLIDDAILSRIFTPLGYPLFFN